MQMVYTCIYILYPLIFYDMKMILIMIIYDNDNDDGNDENHGNKNGMIRYDLIC